MAPVIQLIPRRGAWIVRSGGEVTGSCASEEDALENARALLASEGGMILVHSPTGAIVDRLTIAPAVVHRVLISG